MKKKLLLRSMSIRREGEVLIYVLKGSNHCGHDRNIVPYRGEDTMRTRYVCVVDCKPKTDQRGFLFDQMKIEATIREEAEQYSGRSCEVLAKEIGELIIRELQRDNPQCEIQSLALTLSPDPFQAGVTVYFSL